MKDTTQNAQFVDDLPVAPMQYDSRIIFALDV